MKKDKISLNRAKLLGFRLMPVQDKNPEKFRAVQINAKIGQNGKGPN